MKMDKERRKPQLLRVILVGVLCVAMLAWAATACATGWPERLTDESLALKAKEKIENPGYSGEHIYSAASYKDIYDVIGPKFMSRYSSSKSMFGGFDGDMAVEEMAAPQDAPAEAPAPAPAAGEDSGAITNEAAEREAGADYSETNAQVKGIDEGDIVKTDGKYIYILRDNEVIIMSADGEDSKVLSTTKVADPGEDQYDIMPLAKSDVAEPMVRAEAGAHEYAQELYISGDRMVVLVGRSTWSAYDGGLFRSAYYRGSSEQCEARIYDVSDPAKPVLADSLGQDGNYSSSRLMDGVLYLITNYYVYEEPKEREPGTFVPYLYTNGEKSLVEAGDICIVPEFNSTSYVVVSAVDVAEGERLSTASILGSGNTVYMSHENLYVASGRYESKQSDPYTQDQYTVVEYRESQYTDIARFSIDGGNITLEADGSVPGYLVNQFALDEYQGHLRVVTTINSYSHKEFTDEKYDWTHYEWGEENTNNALWVLDGDLDLTGSVEGLAQDEMVYSVRFDGATGYFVTFRQTDPLFAVDLSDPTAPRVLSALKIPGFSEYLHVYTEGRLFGLGMDADEETGRTKGMKLAMFNVEDPANVTEKHTLLLDSDYSEALYNHKAILISAAKDLIAFPVEKGYDVYGYTDARGFYLRGHFDSGEWYYNTRGLFSGDYIYIVAYEEVTVVDMNDLEAVKTVKF